MAKLIDPEVVPFDESSLIDELLLALVGIHGDIFIDSDDTDDRSERDEEAWQLPGPAECTVSISPDLTWIGESDRQVLLELLRLGWHFKAVNTFVEWEHAAWEPRHRTRPPSVYRRALASGLTELLDDYRCAVLELQGALRREAAPALPTIRHRMWEYMDVLPSLHGLASVQDAVALAPTFPAAELVNALHGGTRSGVPAVRAAHARLLWHCNQVLLQQLAAWMMYGMLQDPNREFFVQPRPHAAASAAASASHQHEDPAAPSAVDAAADAAWRRSAAAAGGGDAGSGAASSYGGGGTAGGRTDGEEAAYREWHSGFHVKPGCLPLYVSADLADTVLFVGRAVRVLRRPAGQSGGGGGGGGGGAAEPLPLQDLVVQFGQAFASLQSEPELSAPRLELLVEALRAHVARLLWRLLVGRAGLLPALGALKDYCLLARGDLWSTFLAEAKPLMGGAPRLQSVDADLAVPFGRAAAKSSAEADPLLAAFSLCYLRGAEAEAAFQVGAAAKGAAGGHPVPPLDPRWDPLALSVRLDWPLGLLLGAEQLRRYNQLFALLLRLRRMQGALDDAWKDLRVMDRDLQRSGPSPPPGPPAPPGPPLPALMREAQDLRNNMAHLVTNLQIYIQTDVIEVNFGALESRIAACQDFSELERAHHLYLSTLLVQSFLTVKSLCAILGDIFQDVAALCSLVLRAGCEPRRLDGGAVGRVRGQFLRHASGLFNIIGSQRILESFRAPHLQQLVTRLDYNGWYSRGSRDGETSTRQ